MLPFHNARLKRYPDGSAELLIGSRPFGGGTLDRSTPAWLDDGEPPYIRFRNPFETPEEKAEREYAQLERDSIAWEDSVGPDTNAAVCRAASLRRSIRRARKAVKDLARSNDWTYFVTLTLDPAKVNRYSFPEVWKHMRHWLGNCVRRKGLIYLLVLEHHKDGALHAHGFFNDALEAVDSGTMSIPGRKAPVRVRSEAQRAAFERMGGHAVYNLPDWGWGFSTAIRLYGERDAAINYVCKYIGKELSGADGVEAGTPEKIGGRWYYSGGALQRPTVEWFDVDVRDWEGVPGWCQPEEYPYASFLTLRVTADGEVHPPYIRGAVDRTNVSLETDAEHDRGGDQPPEAGVTIAPEPSADHDAGQSVPHQSRGSFGAVPGGNRAALTASRPAQIPGQIADFTNLGLSNSRASPAAQPPAASGPPDDK